MQLRHYIHHRHLLLLSPKADTHFTIQRRVEGWVDQWWRLAIYSDGLPVRKQSPVLVVTGPASINFVEQSQRANHCTTPRSYTVSATPTCAMMTKSQRMRGLFSRLHHFIRGQYLHSSHATLNPTVISQDLVDEVGGICRRKEISQCHRLSPGLTGRPSVLRCRKKPKHSKAQSTMPTSSDVRDKPWRPL